MTTNFEICIDDDIHFKAYLHTKVKLPTEYELKLKKYFHEIRVSFRDLNETKYSKLSQVALKATIQLLYERGLFDDYDDNDENFKDYLNSKQDEEGLKCSPESINVKKTEEFLLFHSRTSYKNENWKRNQHQL